ncbi:hypothetical protein F1K75_03195 [Vibrio cholerae]|nr:hypothetical protein [Vibrio cholerae]EGQ9438135.1 hypothetical protein [Vibrio cholerae]EGR0590308.1 hypothetical protein [Vibrio cholerae]RJL26211.1 hypothetical protein D5R89_14290 [Vibrio cholerae]
MSKRRGFGLSFALWIIPFLLEAAGVGYVRSPQSHSLSMLMGTHSLAAYLLLQVGWVYLVF